MNGDYGQSQGGTGYGIPYQDLFFPVADRLNRPYKYQGEPHEHSVTP